MVDKEIKNDGLTSSSLYLSLLSNLTTNPLPPILLNHAKPNQNKYDIHHQNHEYLAH